MKSTNLFPFATLFCLLSVQAKGAIPSSEPSTEASIFSAGLIHGMLNIISWGLLIDLGIVVSKIFKGRKVKIGDKVIPVQMIHGLIMSTAVTLSAIASIIMLRQPEAPEGAHSETIFEKIHKANGWLIGCLSLSSVGGGLVNYTFLKDYKQDIKSKLTLPKMHKLSGGFLYMLTKANIVIGAFTYAEMKWRVLILIYLAILVPLTVKFPKKYKNSFRKPQKIAQVVNVPSTKPVHKKLMEAINSGYSTEEINKMFPGLKWVLLENNVYDLTGWIHPAGNFSIEPVVGREVGRYFYGNYALEGTKIKPHKHSGLSLSYLNTFYVGQKASPESIIVSKTTKKEVASSFNDIWKISGIKTVSGSVSQVDFSNPNYSVKNFGTSPSWLGSHFKVSFPKNIVIARMYTASLSLNEANVKLRRDIFEYFDKTISGSNPSFTYSPNYLAPQETLPLYIKKYSFPNGFTRAIHEMGLDTLIRIEGPIEGNMKFAPKAKGSYCIICAGTGILAVIDFLNVFLWKNLYQILKEKHGVEKAKQINVLDLPLESYFNDLKIDFIGAFPSEDEILGLDIIKKLAEVSKKYGRNNFNARIKGYSDANIEGLKEHFSFEFVKNKVDLNQEAYYVVGPRKLNEQVTESLIALGVPKGKVVLL